MNAPAFLTTLASERLAGEENFTLTKDLRFWSKAANIEIVVPAGYKTNFVTGREIPGIAWLAGTMSEEASAVHDFLYEFGESLGVSRKLADEIFVEALDAFRSSIRAKEKSNGVSSLRRGASSIIDYLKSRAMYIGLRIGGESKYNGAKAQPVDDRYFG